MKLSFMPANLHLSEKDDGTYVVTMGATLILATPDQRRAVRKFNELRQALEAQYPTSKPSDEDKKQRFLRDLVDHQVQHNSFRERPRKAKGTRTFR